MIANKMVETIVRFFLKHNEIAIEVLPLHISNFPVSPLISMNHMKVKSEPDTMEIHISIEPLHPEFTIFFCLN